MALKGQLRKGMGMPSIKNIKSNGQRGFTLLEVLLVAAIIAILAGIVIIAINPSKNLADSRNAQRRSDVTTILNAVYQYSLDNNGAIPAAVTSTAKEVCVTDGASCTSLADLSVLTDNGTYLVAIPIDPTCPTSCATDGTGYEIIKDATTNRITVSAPNAVADGETIEVTR